MTDTVVQGISDGESSLDSRQDPLVHDAEINAARAAAAIYADIEEHCPANARDARQAEMAASLAMRYAQTLADLRLRRAYDRTLALHQEAQNEATSLARHIEISNEAHELNNETNEALEAMSN